MAVRKTILMSGLAALSLSGALLGCGGGGDSTGDPTPTPSPTPTPGPGGSAGRIVYWSEEAGSSDLYAANADGSGKTKLTTDAATHESQPDVSPDGTKVVFLSAPKTSGTKTSVKIMNADGSGQTSLTADDTRKQGPRFSADGTKIVFQGRLDATSSYDGIFVMNLDGTGLTRVSTNVKKDYESPDFSPDGSKIAFVKDDEVWVMNADGTGETKLTDGGMFSYLAPKSRPFWSPDGTRLLYSSTSVDSGSTLTYVVNADGTGVTKVTTGSGNGWSPDGAKLLVYRAKSFADPTGTSKLLLINPDGTGEAALSVTGFGGSW